jgi:RNA polymerase sigma-70 factor (ECF subfamily)
MERGIDPRLQSLMTRLAAGDRSALPPAFAILWPLLRRFTGRHLAPAEAEDAAQEAVVKIFAQAASFDASRSAVAWALGIAGYEVLTARRRRKRRREEPADAATLGARIAPGPDPEASVLARDLEATLEAALGSLAPGDAATLRLYAKGDRPAIAAATFRKRVERALARLRTAWRTTDERT